MHTPSSAYKQHPSYFTHRLDSVFKPPHLPVRVIDHHSRFFACQVGKEEGFWALIKRAWYGSHHHYSKKYMPLYIAETSWKYNERENPNAFESFLRGCMR